MRADEDTGAETKPEEPSKSKSIKSKLKKSGSIIRKFKLKSKSSSSPCVSTESAAKAATASSTDRQTPEGDDNLIKSTSETNLTESSWKSAENLSGDEKVNVQIPAGKGGIISENKEEIVAIERTKSLEDLQTTMPAFGDLILDASTSSHNTAKPSKDHLYKILVIGDLGAGKTSIIKRYVHDFFSQHYRATIGVDFALKVIHWDPNTVIRLQLWDIAGQERYGNMTRVYYKEAVGAFIVFDVTRSNTFESVSNWKADLDSKVQLPDGSSIPCVLIGNKCDQQKEGIVNNATKMNDYCKEKGFTSWYETSAKENINIEDAANALISKILQNDIVINNEAAKDKDQFTLTSKEQSQNGRKCYKC